MAQGKSKAPQDILSELGVDDLYSFLGVEFQAKDKEITTAYRKKALKYHPDKNPDDPTAADRFQRLSKAYNVLTDAAAKAAYDKWLRAKQRAKVRHQELDAKRRKMKEKLESEESGHVQKVEDEREAAKLMQKEIERLREEGFRKIKEQEELLRQQMSKPDLDEDGESDELPTLKVTWKAKKSDETNGGYSEEVLQSVLSQFGPIHHILVSSRKNGKAIVSFHSATDAQAAVGCQGGCGLASNPLTLSWLSGEPMSFRTTEEVSREAQRTRLAGDLQQQHRTVSSPSLQTGCDAGSFQRGDDYESMILMRLRQAQERKRQLEQQSAQDDIH